MTRPVVGRALGVRKATCIALMSSLLGGASGCRSASCGKGPSEIELRDGTGALELTLRRGADDSQEQICDARGRRIGHLERSETFTLTDAAGAERLHFRRQSPEMVLVEGRAGLVYRLFQRPGEVRILTPEGVPLGILSASTKPDRATFHEGSGKPLGSVEPRDHDEVLRAADGSARRYVIHSRQPLASGVFGVPGLSTEEQVALYRFLSL
jgi:hypothetical protein